MDLCGKRVMFQCFKCEIMSTIFIHDTDDCSSIKDFELIKLKIGPVPLPRNEGLSYAFSLRENL